MKHFTFLLISLFLVLTSCSKIEFEETTDYKNTTEVDFNDYWYDGLAELNSYELEQIRYGQVHSGEAVLIFVTEDFSKSKQVKLDNAQASPQDSVKVLKLNFTKKFLTGIYPYSLMMSVFTPVNQEEFPHSMKVSTTTQDWCGHTFAQLNLQKKGFEFTGNSYFETERDRKYQIDNVLLEDEIWNMIRLNPENLPVGKIDIIPGTFFSRLRHKKTEVVKATASITNESDSLSTYYLDYPEYERQLLITFQNEFPHQITKFEETHISGFGSDAKKLTTKAVKKETIKLDYWKRHFNEDRKYRQELGLGI
ncbi:hypothetical protein [Chondrinema litorale]|uniref:hypothetical protein n=1 Tax=Chondrinema litorale TaxID=2994555 RepID=UPI0025434CE3|nr:hypothetical protein [Chondrinema litorale]UZR93045.1 hypothetical protein OQ292_14380 [Chondrinema litorale]